MNTRFFTHAWIISLSTDFKLPALCCFSVWEGRGRGFCCIAPLQAVGRGTETKRWHSPVSLVFIEARTCDRWGHTQSPSSLAGHSTKLLCVGTAVGVKMAAAELREQVLTSLVLACSAYLVKRCKSFKVLLFMVVF